MSSRVSLLQARPRRRAGRTAVALGLAVISALGVAQTAVAAAPWLPPTELAPTATGLVSSLTASAVAPDGTAYAGFARTNEGVSRVYIASRPPGGTFGAPVALSEPGVTASNLRLGVDRQGNATASWLRGGVVQATLRRPGADWSAPQTVSGPNAGAANLTVGADGGAALAWVSGTGTAAVAQVARRQPGGPGAFGPTGGESTFGTPVAVSAVAGASPGYFSTAPSVAIDDVGDVVAMWVRNTDVGAPGTYRLVVETAESRAAAVPTFTTPSQRSSTTVGGVSSGTFNVAMSPGGKATAVWEYTDSLPGKTYRVQYAERQPGANFQTSFWGGSTDLHPTPGTPSEYPRVVVGRDGTTIVVWSKSAGVTASIRPPSGAFSPPRTFSTTGGSAASVALSASGEAVIVWPGGSGNNNAVLSAQRHPGEGDFEGPTEVVRGSAVAPTVIYDSAFVALDDEGNAFVTGRRIEGTNYTPLSISYDVTAPSLSGVSVPSTTTVGTTVTLAASTTDRVGPASISWAFGDGATATGATTSHEYGTPGVYTVKVVATDAVGNRTEETRALAVNAIPAAVNAIPAAVDVDGDGVLAPLDCDDRNAAVRPGVTEILGNAADENCDGRAEPYPTVGATVSLSTKKRSNGKTEVKGLTVKGVVVGDVISLVCATKARGCRKSATTSITVKKGTTASMTKAVKGLALAPKATLTVKITRAAAVARVFTFTMVKRKAPAKLTRCLAPGAAAPTVCG